MVMDDTVRRGLVIYNDFWVTAVPYYETSWEIYYSRAARMSVHTTEDVYIPLLVGASSPTGRYGPQRRFIDNIFA